MTELVMYIYLAGWFITTIVLVSVSLKKLSDEASFGEFMYLGTLITLVFAMLAIAWPVTGLLAVYRLFQFFHHNKSQAMVR